MSTIQEIIDSIDVVYEPFRKVIENYPHAVSVNYVEGQGYMLTVDLDFLEQVQEGQG